jgi:hypothetical protein
VWSRGCTHATTDVNQQSMKGGQFHRFFHSTNWNQQIIDQHAQHCNL